MKYCSHCGNPVIERVPAGDNRPRFVCERCDAIHYFNPRIVAGCVINCADSILLCRRAIEPRKGFWTVPAGFMELGESLAEAALRETWEEARARVELGPLLAIVDVIHAEQVHAFFTARLPQPEFEAGEETLETRLFRPGELPWDEIAFPSVRIALETALAHWDSDSERTHIATAPRLRLR